MSTSRSPVHAQACRILQAYLSPRFPEESARLQALRAQLQDPDGDVFNRAQMRGHITTSAIVLDPGTRQLLLIHHKTLQRWLQPGGHFEPNEAADPLLASALREAREETGVQALQPHPEYFDAASGLALPLDIDSHAIPANPRKQEGAHWHHDYAYLLLADSRAPLRPQLAEVHAATWQTVRAWAEAPDLRFQRVACKLAALGLA
ncbi:MAG: NUDIX hydrolase [Burkholderiales bacterium PBB2]|nr:MAG: NUDIX hydrolase [Burkholderiales bacterium PBB2]